MIPLTERLTITLDPRILARIEEVALRHYGGSKSKAVTGLFLHEWMVDLGKQKAGKPHTHWISAPLALRPDDLEPLIVRLVAGDADYVGDYTEKRIDERASKLADKMLDAKMPKLPGME